MTKRLGLLSLLAALAMTATVTAIPARADDDHGKRRLVVSGEVTAVVVGETERVLTIDRGEADDDPADDVQVRLTADSKIVPKDAEVAVGSEVKAVLLPAVPDELSIVLQLVVKVEDDEDDDDDDRDRREMHGCGTIASLPADVHDGTWTVTVKDGELSFVVNGETEVEPEDAVPAVGDRVCFELEQTDAGWVAEEVKLKGEDDDDRDNKGHRVELHGTIQSLPDDQSGEWDLVLAVEGHGDVTIHVDADTEIEGDLAVGARVAVKAKVTVDAAGVASYLAERIKLLGERRGGQDRAPKSVHFEGIVTAVSADGGTWTLDDEGTEVVILVTADTWIRGLLPGQSIIGRHAEGVAKVQADGSLVAKFVKIDPS
jgi:hypothetical protein